MANRVINKVTSTSGNLPPVLLDLTSDTVNERNLERDQTAHNSGGQKITGQMAIEDAEAWARGTRNGTPVGPADETYNNNSKYYSIVSGSIMQMAGQQAIAAATSATNAAESERAADTSETNAKASEISAANSAVISGSCMNIAGVHAGDAEAWAIGKRNGQLVPPVDPAYNNNSKYYKDLCESIAGSLASVLKPKGTCLFVNLPTIADSQPGDTWNIEDEFTTTSDFREGAGKLVEAGANVYLTIDNKWDVLAGTTSDYIGATASTAAIHGLVPAAQAGDENKALFGDGTWGTIDDILDPVSTNPIQNQAVANPIEAIVNTYGSKNLLPNNATTQVLNGVTFTVNSDGSVSLSGTATAQASIEYGQITLPAGTYTYTDETTPSNQTYFMNLEEVGAIGNINLVDLPYTWTASHTATLVFRLYVRSGQNVDGVTFKPMIRDARISDDTYVPYAMTNRELTENVTAISQQLSTNILQSKYIRTGSSYTKVIITRINSYEPILVVLRKSTAYPSLLVIAGYDTGIGTDTAPVSYSADGLTVTITTGIWAEGFLLYYSGLNVSVSYS